MVTMLSSATLRNTFDGAGAQERCRAYRRRILDISQQVAALHIAPAFSCTEMVDAVYHGLMRRNGDGTFRDIFLMSKGHGCMIQYVILEEMGILSRADLDLYCKPDGILGAHPDFGTPGIAASTGSLGHGLGIATGQAYAEKLKGTDAIVYCVLSDGEFQEGSTWEAMMMAANLRLGGLVALMDNNDFGGLERMSEGHPAFYPLVPRRRGRSAGRCARSTATTARQSSTRYAHARAIGRSLASAGRSRARASPSWSTCRSGITARPTKRNTARPWPRSKEGRVRNKFAETFYELGKADPRLCVIVADISPAGSIAKFRQDFPDRFINTGVAEQIMIGMAAGMAQRGLRPFAYTIATFTLYRPFEMVRDDLCYQNLPVTIVGIGGGVTYSTLGGTHHAQEDVSIACSIPNMNVIAPCDPAETEAATRWCAQQEIGPVYLRLGKAGEPDLVQWR